MEAIALKAFGDKSLVLLIKFPAALFTNPSKGPSAKTLSIASSIAKESLISKLKDEILP